jgi:parallel beta-helix repeat protein
MTSRLIAAIGVVLFITGCSLRQVDSAKSEISANAPSGIMIASSQLPADPVHLKTGGLYYLSGDRRCKETGIIIEAEHVTLDLGGHQLIGPGMKSGQNYGILTNNYKNLEVRNGTITGFGDRAIVDRGIQQETGQKRILNVRIVSNGACGICIGGSGNVIRNCNCSNNAANGICPGVDCIVADNICSGNSHNGILAGSGCVITGNTLSHNGQSGISAYAGCMVAQNTASGNNQSSNTEHAGIKLFDGNSAQNNVMRDNRVNNIFVKGSGNVIEDNVITASASDKAGNGIFLVSEKNNCQDNYFMGNKTDTAGAGPANPKSN